MAKITPFPTELIIKRMRLENPWWDSGKVPEEYEEFKRRLYFDMLYKIVSLKKPKRAVVLMGPRRVGKTVMLYQVIDQLIKDGQNKRKVCYLSIDAPIYNNIGLEQLFEMCKEALGENNADGFVMILDEIQYLKNWEQHLKTIVDLFPNTKFIVSGSAAAALKLKSNESGAGRFTDFMLPSLTFEEYLHLKDLSYLVSEQTAYFKTTFKINYSSKDIQTLNEHFINYINFGGYPEVILNDRIQQDPGRFIRNDIIDKVLLRDLPSLYGISDVQELNSLFNVIAYNSGNECNLEKLSQESGANKQTIRKYLEYLEAAFLIKRLYPVDINTKRFLRESRFKIYLANPSMRCALFAPISSSDDHFGQMVETAVIAQYLSWGSFPLHFAAWQGGEVDFISTDERLKPEWALEVKWSNQYFENPNKLKSLIKYCKENQLGKALVTTIDKTGSNEFQGVKISYNPAAIHCYVVGKTINSPNDREYINLLMNK